MGLLLLPLVQVVSEDALVVLLIPTIMVKLLLDEPGYVDDHRIWPEDVECLRFNAREGFDCMDSLYPKRRK